MNTANPYARLLGHYFLLLGHIDDGATAMVWHAREMPTGWSPPEGAENWTAMVLATSQLPQEMVEQLEAAGMVDARSANKRYPEVAIKAFRSKVKDRDNALDPRELAQREWNTLRSVNQRFPGLAPKLLSPDDSDVGGSTFVIMEWIDGITLDRLTAPFAETDAIDAVECLARSVGQLKILGINVTEGLKPGSLMLQESIPSDEIYVGRRMRLRMIDWSETANNESKIWSTSVPNMGRSLFWLLTGRSPVDPGAHPGQRSIAAELWRLPAKVELLARLSTVTRQLVRALTEGDKMALDGLANELKPFRQPEAAEDYPGARAIGAQQGAWRSATTHLRNMARDKSLSAIARLNACELANERVVESEARRTVSFAMHLSAALEYWRSISNAPREWYAMEAHALLRRFPSSPCALALWCTATNEETTAESLRNVFAQLPAPDSVSEDKLIPEWSGLLIPEVGAYCRLAETEPDTFDSVDELARHEGDLCEAWEKLNALLLRKLDPYPELSGLVMPATRVRHERALGPVKLKHAKLTVAASARQVEDRQSALERAQTDLSQRDQAIANFDRWLNPNSDAMEKLRAAVEDHRQRLAIEGAGTDIPSPPDFDLLKLSADQAAHTYVGNLLEWSEKAVKYISASSSRIMDAKRRIADLSNFSHHLDTLTRKIDDGIAADVSSIERGLLSLKAELLDSIKRLEKERSVEIDNLKRDNALLPLTLLSDLRINLGQIGIEVKALGPDSGEASAPLSNELKQVIERCRIQDGESNSSIAERALKEFSAFLRSAVAYYRQHRDNKTATQGIEVRLSEHLTDFLTSNYQKTTKDAEAFQSVREWHHSARPTPTKSLRSKTWLHQLLRKTTSHAVGGQPTSSRDIDHKEVLDWVKRLADDAPRLSESLSKALRRSRALFIILCAMLVGVLLFGGYVLFERKGNLCEPSNQARWMQCVGANVAVPTGVPAEIKAPTATVTIVPTELPTLTPSSTATELPTVTPIATQTLLATATYDSFRTWEMPRRVGGEWKQP